MGQYLHGYTFKEKIFERKYLNYKLFKSVVLLKVKNQ